MNKRRVAGGIIINEYKQIFLGQSPKWNGWVIPAGGVEEGETDEEAFLREMKEELNVSVIIIQKLNETTKESQQDHLLTATRFHFINYLAYIPTSELPYLRPNEEFSKWDWVTLDTILEKPLVGSVRELVEYSIPIITSLQL